MDCPSCGHSNREGARFCAECATPLVGTVACPSCATVHIAGTRYCDSCGHALARSGASIARPGSRGAHPPEYLAEKIRAGRATLEGERKQVTVLFADVMGSLELAEQTDPERWRGIMQRFFAILCDGVHRFEGTVDKFTGDGIMALFGAPIAHEDHATRACRAALLLFEQLERFSAELRHEHDLSLPVRIGLNSGEVVVGAIGEDLDMEYTAIGHTVGLAERMQALAKPGKAHLTEHTATLVEGYFDLRDLGQFDVKGVHEPVRVFQLAGLGTLRTPFDVSRAHGLSPFVGREAETATLEAALARASQASAQVICVVGEAGVGKSRLCHEFAERCRERGIEVWEGHCKARGETLPLMPLLELLRTYYGVSDRDTGQAAREKIAGRVLALDESLTDELPLLFDLLGVADPERRAPRIDPEARQRRLFAMLNRLLAARSEHALAVFVFEDLQWIDAGSAAFLENFVDALPGTRTLVIASFRPEHHPAWMERPYCDRLALAPLSPEAAERLLRDLLGEHPSLDGLAERINERTGGNPFFIEELVQGLAAVGSLAGERGAYRLVRPIDERAIPVSVQAVVAARIDRLGERDKQLLQTAAVIGREFAEPVLRRVTELPEPQLRAGLRALLNGELIYERALLPEPEYAFKHQLIEEVAYRSQLAEPRALLHGRVARAIQDLHPDRLDELAALVFDHLEQAGEHLDAARWGARAAGWAGFADPAEALRQWRRVTQLTDSAPDSAEAVAIGTWARVYVMNLGWRAGADEFEIRRAFEEASDLAQRGGDTAALAAVNGTYAYTRVMAGDAALVDMLLEALGLAEESGDQALWVTTVAGTGLALFLTGRLREALGLMEPAFKLWEQDPSLGSGLATECPYAACLWQRAWFGGPIVGRCTVQEARRECEQALALADEYADVENACWAHVAQVGLCRIEGDGQSAFEHARQAVVIADRTGSSWLRGNAYGYVGLAHVLCGEYTGAVAALERSLEILAAVPTGAMDESPHLACLADAYLGVGQADRARQVARRAVDLALSHGARFHEIRARLALAHVLINTGGVGARTEIASALESVAALVGEIGAQGYKPFLHEQRARLAELSGETETYERELREAQRLFAAIGARPRAARLEAQLAAVPG